MQHIDETRLETDLAYRFQYLQDFIGFGKDDVACIQASAPKLVPKFPEIVDATYEKLLEFDATARHFLPRQHGFEGNPPEDLASLSIDHAQIQFRKDHLSRYLMHLIGHSYNEKMAVFLDMAGKMHTPKAGNPEIDVPLVQMNALMGLLSDILTRTILKCDFEPETAFKTIRAFQKVLWIQNDLISRHYLPEPKTG
ncbi:MAG: hypothetical protein Tsb009_37450 [Planctomycetaceae bacterium]